jgi:hypothetical protein
LGVCYAGGLGELRYCFCLGRVSQAGALRRRIG